jgi:hypothetical protein
MDRVGALGSLTASLLAVLLFWARFKLGPRSFWMAWFILIVVSSGSAFFTDVRDWFKDFMAGFHDSPTIVTNDKAESKT